MKDIEEYDEKAAKDLLQGVLRQNESDPDLEVKSVESSPACAAGDNFMSTVTRLVVNVETIKRYSSKKYYLMKRQLASQERRQALKSDPAFINEANAYQIVVPALEHFSNERLPFPECLYASKECVVLSDLSQDGFKMADRMKGLNLLQTSLALKELGRYHGISLATKFSNPKLFKNLTSVVQEFLFVPNSAQEFGAMLENALNIAIIGLKTHCKTDIVEIDSIIQKLEKLRGSVFQTLFEIVCPKEPFAVICHGDFYINNMLFRESDKGIPEEVVFVDLQAVRHSTLATDILYFFGTSLEKGLLLAEHDALFDIYYTSLSKELSRKSSVTEKISLEAIKEEVKSNALFGLIMGFLLLQAITARPGAIDTEKELGVPSIEDTVAFLSPAFFDRLQDLVITFNKLGYF